jgi:hypothetical protein
MVESSSDKGAGEIAPSQFCSCNLMPEWLVGLSKRVQKNCLSTFTINLIKILFLCAHSPMSILQKLPYNYNILLVNLDLSTSDRSHAAGLRK